MNVSAISQTSAENRRPRRHVFISYSNSFMSVPESENVFARANAANPAGTSISKPQKLGIENLQEFTIFPKEVVDGQTIITA